MLEEDAPKRTLISGIVTELPHIKRDRFHIVAVPENQCAGEVGEIVSNFSAITLRSDL